MKLTLWRKWITEQSSIGELLVNGKHECFVLEDPPRDVKVPGITGIPAGLYQVIITYSPTFKREMPLLVGVPGFEGIRIHPGNSADDTSGCLIPGRTHSVDWVGQSRLAYGDLYDKIRVALLAGEFVGIEIINGEESCLNTLQNAS